MEKSIFILSRKKLKILFVYFLFLILIGFIFTVFSLCNEIIPCIKSITLYSLVGGIGTSLLGSSIFYLRKLYKSAIQSIISSPETEIHKLNETGLYIYYLLRPIFAVTFSVIVHIGFKASVSIVSVKEANLDTGLIYVTMIISFFVGFAAGDVITKLENISKEITDKAIDKIT
jgi:hypothetical protein